MAPIRRDRAITSSSVLMLASLVLSLSVLLAGISSSSSSSSSFFLVTAATEADTNSDLLKEELQTDAHMQKVANWIRSHPSGYLHPSTIWKRLGPDGVSGPFGMFTTTAIAKGTTLLKVPRDYIIDSYKTYNPCITVARMLDEYDNNNNKDGTFGPYLSYLFDTEIGGTSTGLLPSSWSHHGKKLLNAILDDELAPWDFDYHESVFEVCDGNFRSEDKHEPLKDPKLKQQAEDAYLFYISRSWSDKMVPVLDMYNHRNGRWLNVESTTAHDYDSDAVTAYALRDIAAGEQLQNTYSECMDEDCEYGEIKYTYVTQQILQDYGFVELYPRRWTLGPDENEVTAEIDELEDGTKQFQWIFRTPDSDGLEWIATQLERLQNMEPKLRADAEKHRKRGTDSASSYNIDHEVDTLLEFHEGYIEVLTLALQNKDKLVGVTHAQFREELKQRHAAMDEL